MKLIRNLVIAVAVCLLIGMIGGCSDDIKALVGKVYTNDAVMDTTKVYDVQSAVRVLDIRINAAEIQIRQTDKFLVESNLKYLKVEENGGVLTLKEDMDHASGYSNAMLTVGIPEGMEFDRLVIKTTAAKLTADRLSAKTLKLELGAGGANIAYLSADTAADIQGGAGQITVADGKLNDLELDMGVGRLKLTAALSGDSELSLGMGASDVTLLGSRDDYRLELEKGVGEITVDGKTVTDFGSYGTGINRVEIEGGVGKIRLNFSETTP